MDRKYLVEVTPKESARLQDLAFACGFTWGGTSRVAEPKHTDKPFLSFYLKVKNIYYSHQNRQVGLTPHKMVDVVEMESILIENFLEADNVPNDTSTLRRCLIAFKESI